MVRKSSLFLITFFFTLPIILPLLKPGFPITDDADWFIIRFTAFHQALVDGQLPVRWLGRLNHNYGYPVANFNYPLYMYFAQIPKIIGFSFVSSIKLVFIGSIIFSSIFSLLWLQTLFNKWAGIVGSLFYVYNPYFLFDIYKRGSIGEVLAVAIIAFLLYSITAKKVRLISIGYALLIMSHNTLALLFIPILFIYQLVIHSNFKLINIKYAILSVTIGFGLSAFFWLPAIYELRFTVFDQVQVSNFSNYFLGENKLQLLGFINIIVFFVSGLFWFVKRKLVTRQACFFIILAITGMFLSLSMSAFIWKVIAIDRFIQFPFRILSLWIVGLSYLSAFLSNIALKSKYMREFGSKYLRFFSANKPKQSLIRGFILLLLSLVGLYLQSMFFFKNIEIVDRPESYYATNEDSTTIKNEYMPRWVKANLTNRADNKVEIKKGKGSIDIVEFKNHKLKLRVKVDETSVLVFNTLYYPGWKAFVDKKPTKISYKNDKGIMMINMPAGRHKVEFIFTETKLRLFADLTSLVTFMAIVASKWII